MESPIHVWFELSYSSYLVLHRSLMEGMPMTWQRMMVQLLNEIEETYDTSKIPGDFWIRAKGKNNKFIPDPYKEYRHPPDLPYKTTNIP